VTGWPPLSGTHSALALALRSPAASPGLRSPVAVEIDRYAHHFHRYRRSLWAKLYGAHGRQRVRGPR
jgi:hypothetical protein